MSHECLALNKKGGCCRNWTQLLEDGSSSFTCHAHRNFFNNHDQLKRKVLWHRGMYLQWADHGVQRRIAKWLENRLLCLTPQDFHQFQPEILHNFSVLFLLMARHTDIDLIGNANLWVECVKWLWKNSWRIVYSPAANPPNITAEDMITVLCRSSSGIRQFYTGLFNFPDEPNLRNTMSEEDWFAFFTKSLDNPMWAHLFWAEEDHDKCITFGFEKLPWLRNHPLTPILTGDRYRQWLQNSKTAWYCQQNERMNCVKEELMAVACHPSRMWSWTLDVEAQNQLAKRWDGVTEAVLPLRLVLEEVRLFFTVATDN